MATANLHRIPIENHQAKLQMRKNHLPNLAKMVKDVKVAVDWLGGKMGKYEKCFTVLAPISKNKVRDTNLLVQYFLD